MADRAGRAPLPFSVGISNVPGPPEPLHFTGARDNLPHLQHLAIFMGEALDEIGRILLGDAQAAPA